MKTLTLLVLGVFAGIVLSAQNQGPIPKLSQQMADYFSYFPKEKVFITTDKSQYKPGETIWFRAFVTTGNHLPVAKGSDELFVKLYDKKGTLVLSEIFRLKNGATSGDVEISPTIPKGNYSLVAYTSAHSSPEEVSLTTICINPQYSNQLVAEVVAKDSISMAGEKNELFIILRENSGEIQKNTQLRYQIMNGADIIEKGKLKTDERGKVTLPFTLPAKTNGEPFVCELSDNKEEWKYEVFLPTNIDPLEVRFFPEGGNLIAGAPSKIGFTAFNKWGLPVELEASVLDQNGKSVSLVKTFTKGLGLFTIPNPENQLYKLVISGKNGQKQSFELPAPLPDGLALSVVKTDAGFISANLIFTDKQKHAIALVVTQGNAIYWAADMEINGIGRIKIPTETLPHGINQLAVFSNEGHLLAQRIVFVDKKQELKIEVQPEKNKLVAGEQMKVKIRLADEAGQPILGNVSVSVSDRQRNSTAQPLINKCLLVGSGLETPFSVVSGAFKGGISPSVLFDVYLIANRVKGFDWVKIKAFKPENANTSGVGTGGISGIVTDKNENKVNKAKVSLVNNKNMQLLTTTTNTDGRFSFPNQSTASTEDFSVKATDPEGKRELKVVLNKNFEARIGDFVSKNSQKYNFVRNDKVIDETYFSSNPDLFTKAPKVVKTNTIAIDNQRRMLSTATNLLDVIKSIKPYKITNNQIVFVGSENSINYQGGALIILDGQQMGTDISSLQNISPIEVDYINVSTNPMDIQRYTGLNSVGIIEIFMKKAKITESDSQAEKNSHNYDGAYRIPNLFPVEPVNLKRDNRTTLMWIPNQQMNETGWFEFSVTASKILSDFVIEVQGITEKGQMGSGKAVFSVTK